MSRRLGAEPTIVQWVGGSTMAESVADRTTSEREEEAAVPHNRGDGEAITLGAAHHGMAVPSSLSKYKQSFYSTWWLGHIVLGFIYCHGMQLTS